MIKIDNLMLERIMKGAQILGCGGGGEVEWGKRLAGRVIDQGRDVIIKDIAEVPDDSLVFIVGAVGGGVEAQDIEKARPYLEGLSSEEHLEIPILKAVEELSRYLGTAPSALIPTEIGAGNMAVTLYAAAMKDIFVLDGDCCGRAKPMVSISTTVIGGISPTPLAAVSPMGDVLILKDAVDDSRAEDILRRFAVSSGGVCLVARCPAPLSAYKKAMVTGSFSHCLSLGKVVEKARETGDDPVRAIGKNLPEASCIFKGKILNHEKEKKGGFITGWLKIEGTEDFSGRKCSIWLKNEFICAFVEETLAAGVPDVIAILNHRTFMGVSNWDDTGDRIGDPVSVIKIPAAPIWNSQKGRKIFSFETLGFDGKLK